MKRNGKLIRSFTRKTTKELLMYFLSLNASLTFKGMRELGSS